MAAFDPVVNWRGRVDNLKQLSGILHDAGQKDGYSQPNWLTRHPRCCQGP